MILRSRPSHLKITCPFEEIQDIIIKIPQLAGPGKDVTDPINTCIASKGNVFGLGAGAE